MTFLGVSWQLKSVKLSYRSHDPHNDGRALVLRYLDNARILRLSKRSHSRSYHACLRPPLALCALPFVFAILALLMLLLLFVVALLAAMTAGRNVASTSKSTPKSEPALTATLAASALALTAVEVLEPRSTMSTLPLLTPPLALALGLMLGVVAMLTAAPALLLLCALL